MMLNHFEMPISNMYVLIWLNGHIIRQAYIARDYFFTIMATFFFLSQELTRFSTLFLLLRYIS